MAVKSFERNAPKEKGARTTRKTVQGVSADEIALRDEILELKRQVMILKRTNQQNLVKFRKYEDEAKRKDRQIEQLMDPRQNSQITKILSTKGAAILMNLKDQNNALVQMILNKDLQIKRLIAEIKMSKLYASSKRKETCRAETIRLRNLLIKSQEMLKENVDSKEREMTSICVNGNSPLETSSSSDQSSPRELEEMRFTIQSLETHIKYSNDLLASKNQEILQLSEELSTLRKIIQYKTFKHAGGKFEHRGREFIDEKQFTTEPTYLYKQQSIQQPNKIFPNDEVVFETPSKFSYETRQPYSAPSSSQDWVPTDELTSKYFSVLSLAENTVCNGWNRQMETETREGSKVHTTVRKIFFRDLGPEAVQKAKIEEECENEAKAKWKKALAMYKKYKKLNLSVWNEEKNKLDNPPREKLDKVGDFETDESDLETHEFKMLEKSIEDESDKTLKSEEIKVSKAILEKEEEGDTTDNRTTSSLEFIQNNTENEMSPGQETQTTHQELPKESQKEVRVVYESTPRYENNANSLRQIYRQSLDSSFESENGYSCNEVQKLQVQVEINSVPTDSDSNSVSKTSSPIKSAQEDLGNDTFNDVFNDEDDDDDDVVVRGK